MSLERALELAERGRWTTHPNPVVGCVLVHGPEIVGEAWHAQAGEAHAEVLALRQAGERARGAIAYVTMEPCNHHGRTPPCTDALIEAGVAQVLVGSRDPNPEAAGGVERLREAGIEVAVEEQSSELAFRCRDQNAGWRRWVSDGRPFVTLKLATTLDARVTVPRSRWVTGESSRRVVHELRARSDAVAVGMGTARADRPRLDARGVDAPRQPRRLVFGRGELPAGSELELRSGALAEELRALAEEGVQTLLLEGGPTLATAFLEADLVDRLLVFVAPTLSGVGPRLLGDLAEPRALTRFESRRCGDDVLLSGYLHEP